MTTAGDATSAMLRKNLEVMLIEALDEIYQYERSKTSRSLPAGAHCKHPLPQWLQRPSDLTLRMKQCRIPEETSECISLVMKEDRGRAHIVGEDVSYVEKCDAFLAINEIFDEGALYNLEEKLNDD